MVPVIFGVGQTADNRQYIANRNIWQMQYIMKFKLTRDSVCMGDDVDAPHEREIEINGYDNGAELLKNIAHGYIDVHYPEQIWVCSLNGINVAAYSRGRSIIKNELLKFLDLNVVHFIYVWNRNEFDLESALNYPEMARKSQ